MNAQTVTMDALCGQTQKMFDDGYRLLTMSCVDLGEGGFDLFYHFDKDLELVNFRLTIEKGVSVPSISPIYFCGLLIENEIRDQFGVIFDGLVLDFGGTLYLEEDVRTSPFCKMSITEKTKEG